MRGQPASTDHGCYWPRFHWQSRCAWGAKNSSASEQLKRLISSLGNSHGWFLDTVLSLTLIHQSPKQTREPLLAVYPQKTGAYLETADDLEKRDKVLWGKHFLRNGVGLLFLLAVGTDVGIQGVCLCFGDPHTPPMKPVLTPVTSDVEPGQIPCKLSWICDES